jgi:hypothetical protein
LVSFEADAEAEAEAEGAEDFTSDAGAGAGAGANSEKREERVAGEEASSCGLMRAEHCKMPKAARLSSIEVVGTHTALSSATDRW